MGEQANGGPAWTRRLWRRCAPIFGALSAEVACGALGSVPFSHQRVGGSNPASRGAWLHLLPVVAGAARARWRAASLTDCRAVPPNVPLVSGALRPLSSPFLRFLPLLAFGPCGRRTDYGSRGWGFESSWAHSYGRRVIAGRSAARLARLVRDQEVGGSNPLAPTDGA